jgi:hypothetical protein
MRLKYPYLPSSIEPIDNTEKFLEAQKEIADAYRQWSHLNDQVLAVPLDEQDPHLVQEVERLDSLSTQLLYSIGKRLPVVMISICPYCQQEVWTRVGIYSLTSSQWYLGNGDGCSRVVKGTACEHLFCIDGALNLNGHQPIEAHAPVTTVTNRSIYMAAGVPFVKPRVLNLPTMLAVIHSFPVAEKYTAYPVVYFAQEMPSQDDFCIPWACTEYVDFHHKSNRQLKSKDHPKVVMIAKRSDVQDYDLQKWVDKKKLFWVDPITENGLLTKKEFPYASEVGKRHPYCIRDGVLTDLPNPVAREPEVRLEW